MPTSSLQDKKKYYGPELSQHLPYFKDSAVGSDSAVSLSLVKVATERQTSANPDRWIVSTGLFWNKYSSRGRKLN